MGQNDAEHKVNGTRPPIALLREPLMALWQETFGDSREYVSLVFDNYLDEEHSYVVMDGATPVSSMLSVPYTFRTTGGDGNPVSLRCEYFCGLATRPGYRGKGYISSLMVQAENDATSRGVDFLALIPASASLREFYRSKGWTDAFPRMVFSPCGAKPGLPAPDGSEAALCVISGGFKCHYPGLPMAGVPDEVMDVGAMAVECHRFMKNNGSVLPSLSICHSEADIKAVMLENQFSGGEVIIARDKGTGEMLLLAFCVRSDSGGYCVRYLKSKNEPVLFTFLRFLYSHTSGRFVINTSFSGAERITLQNLGLKCKLERYGMLKLLNQKVVPHISMVEGETPDSYSGEMYLMLD